MNDLPDGTSNARQLARLALSSVEFNPAKQCQSYDEETVTTARDQLAQSMKPLKQVEPKFDGTESERIIDSLRMLGMKVRPEMSSDQARSWCLALIAALSDLPSDLVRKAAAQAIHVVFAFPNEVEAKVREIAEGLVKDRMIAIRRLDLMMAEFARAMAPQTNLIADHRADPLTQDELASLQQSAIGADIIRLGLKLGHIHPSDLPDPDNGGHDHA